MDRSPSHTIHSPQLWSFAPQGSNLRPGDKYPGLANLVPLSWEDFPGGHPSWYYSRSGTLNCGVPMGSGAFVLNQLSGTRFAKPGYLSPGLRFEPWGAKDHSWGLWMVWEGLRSMARTACAVPEGVRPMAGPLHVRCNGGLNEVEIAAHWTAERVPPVDEAAHHPPPALWSFAPEVRTRDTGISTQFLEPCTTEWEDFPGGHPSLFEPWAAERPQAGPWMVCGFRLWAAPPVGGHAAMQEGRAGRAVT
ncbi:hypothetical protein Sjap_015969 [Stephania japonica]|uniref:Uncharacterized protein n=1 Tax=Stephania japonica TaxID=461633 RepID=A0AAP0NRD7_9MAGN